LQNKDDVKMFVSIKIQGKEVKTGAAFYTGLSATW